MARQRSIRVGAGAVGGVAVALAATAMMTSAAAAASPAPCSHTGTVHVDAHANHSTISLRCGQRLVVSLSENLDGGPNSARWHALPVAGGELRIGRHHYSQPKQQYPPLAGASGTFHQHYRSVANGDAAVRLQLTTTKPDQVDKRFIVHVHVH